MPLFIRVVSLYVVTFLIALSTIQVMVLIDNANYKAPTRQLITKPKAPTVVKIIIDGEPVSLQVERLGVNLSVKYGAYDVAKDSWTLSDDSAYFAQVTALPNNQRGNTFIYGHNSESVLLPLRQLVVGDIAIIKTSNNHTFKYSYASDALVPPDLTSVLSDDPPTPRLTIMTCEGMFNTSRRLMYFDLVETI